MHVDSIARVAILIAIATASAAGSDAAGANSAGSIRGPIAGYVAQSTRPELRAIVGVPGAAAFSDMLSLSSDVTRVRVAPGEPYALIERHGVAPAVAHLAGASAGQETPVAGALPAADLVAFSPYGRSVLLFAKQASRLQVITGLPDLPRIAQDLDGRLLPEAPVAMAISDDGASVLLSSAGTVYRLLPDGSTRTVASVGDAASLAFFPNSGDAAIADRSTGSVYRFHGQTGVASLQAVSTALNGLGEINASIDGDTVFVANPGGHRISSVRLLNGEVRSLDVAVSPVQMDRLGQTETFLISSQSAQPAWLFQWEGGQGRTVFVPAANSNPRPHPRYVRKVSGDGR